MTAPKMPLRSAEEIAREMVRMERGNHVWWVRVGGIDLCPYADSDAVERDVGSIRASIAVAIERDRADRAARQPRDADRVEAIDHYREALHRIWQGDADPRRIAADYLGEDPPTQSLETIEEQEARHRAAIRSAREEDLERAAHEEPAQPHDVAGVGHATTCGTCLTVLTEEPHRPGCPEPVYIAERQRVAALVRAARRWAAVARKVGGAAEEHIAADIDLVEAVEALDAAAGAAQQSRDLAGRIRALVQEYAGRWADARGATESKALDDAIGLLREALRDARAEANVWPRIAKMRIGQDRWSEYGRVLMQAADDLERILREHEVQR